jgi:hypothetical protein
VELQESGDAKPCFVLSQLEEMDSWSSVSEEDEDILKGTAASMFSAGETTASRL